MTSNIDAQLSPVNSSFSDTFTQLLEGASEVTRISLEAYVTGLSSMVEQQERVRDAFQQWFSSVMVTESATPRRLVEGGAAVLEMTVDSAKPAGPAGSRAAKRNGGAVGRASTKRPTAAPRERRPATTPASKLALANALRSGPAKWTSEGYESLTAAEIIERLPQFTQRELGEVEAHEKAHQSRETVLQRVASLRGQEPVPGYDELTVPEIKERIALGDTELAARVRQYEGPHKGRDGVLHAAAARLGNS
jgi:hypothetical protein